MSNQSVIARVREAFERYENAIESAQRSYHNYQEWGPEEYGPIDAARSEFYDALADVEKLSTVQVAEETE